MNKKLAEHQANEAWLFKEISGLIESTRQHSLRLINKTSVILYWHIGHKINQNILDDNVQNMALTLSKI